MMLSIPRLSRAALLTLCALAACSDQGTTPPDNSFVWLDRSTLTLETGSSTQLRVLSSRGSLSNTHWTSSNTGVAEVDQAGQVTAVDTGEAVITSQVTLDRGPMQASAKVRVTRSVTQLEVKAGDGQTGVVGTELPVAALVKVTDAAGRGVRGASVTFVASGPGGTYTTTSATTAGDGTASTRWGLCSEAGKHQLDVTVPGTTAQATLQATGVAGPPASFVQQGGAGQTAPAGTLLPVPLTVRLTDAYGNVIPGAAVTWQADPQSGSLTPASAVTDSAGVASARWLLGSLVGQQGGAATSSAGTIRLSAIATSSQATATSILIIPDTFTVAVGGTRKLGFEARDANGNLVTGVAPSWSSVAPAVAIVDGTGTVTGVAVGGTHIRVTAGSLSDDATVTVTAATGPVASSVSVTPASAGLVAGSTLQAAAVVKDASGTVIAGAPVSWSSSNPTIAQVNASGLVQALAVGTAVITAASGPATGTLNVTVTAPATAGRVVITPQADTITAIGYSTTYTAVLRDGAGNVVPGATIAWTSLQPAVASVSTAGEVIAKQVGTALIVAAATGCTGGCQADTALTLVRQDPARVELSTTSVALTVGGTSQLSASVKDAAGVAIPNASVAWSASPSGIVTVSSTGLVSGVAAGNATVTASSSGLTSSAAVTVTTASTPPPPSDAASFIIGPQVPLNSSPWPFHDNNMVAMAKTHADAAVAAINGTDIDAAWNSVYYDLPYTLYILASRSGDATHRQLAQNVANAWWTNLPRWLAGPFEVAPRHAGLGGLMMYALNGGGTTALTFQGGASYNLWQWITEYTRYHYNVWLGPRLNNSELYYGVREGGYILLYCAWLARVHPDAAVRDEFRAKALAAARDYYARLQYANGGWFWIDIDEGNTTPWEQPFMVGLLLEGMIATHQLTGDATVRAAIIKSVDHLWTTYRFDKVPELPAVAWRAVPYYDYADGTWTGKMNLADGWDTNTIREERQGNSLILHAFGYAYQLTRDTKYRDRGDEMFAATFGKGQGPLTDPYYDLADYRAKEFGQSYRTAGRYLAWRQ